MILSKGTTSVAMSGREQLKRQIRRGHGAGHRDLVLLISSGVNLREATIMGP